MKMGKLQSKLSLLIAATTILAGSALVISTAPVQAQTILEQEGSLAPAQGEHTFTGNAGQSVVITLDSEDFDTVLSVLGPDGEEIAYNDDSGNSLNSRVIITLPTRGTYTAVARSFSGQAGDYTLSVREASEYEDAFSRAETALYEGDYAAAIAAYNEAIQLNSEDPLAFEGLADALYAEAQSLMPEEVERIIANYERAAELYEAEGNTEAAQYLREQITYIDAPEVPYYPPF